MVVGYANKYDWQGIILSRLRVLGLIFFYHSVRSAVTAGSVLLDGKYVEPWLQFGFRIALFQCFAYAAVSLWLIGGAPWLFRWAFREQTIEAKAPREAEQKERMSVAHVVDAPSGYKPLDAPFSS